MSAEMSSPVTNQPRCHIPSLALSFGLKSNLIFDLMDEKFQLKSYSLGGMWLLKIEIVYHFKKLKSLILICLRFFGRVRRITHFLEWQLQKFYFKVYKV